MESSTRQRKRPVDLKQALIQREKVRRLLKTLVVFPEPDDSAISIAIKQLLDLENQLAKLGHNVKEDETDFDHYMELAQEALKFTKRKQSPEKVISDKEAKLEALKLSKDSDWPFFKSRFVSRFAHCEDAKKFELLRQACSNPADITIIDRYFKACDVDAALQALADKYEDEGHILNSVKQKLDNLSPNSITAKSPVSVWEKLSDVSSWCNNISEHKPTLNLLLFEKLQQKLDVNLQTELFLDDTSHSLSKLDHFILKWYKAISLRENSTSISNDKPYHQYTSNSQTTQVQAKPLTVSMLNFFSCAFCDGNHDSADCYLTPYERKECLRQTRRCFNCLNLGHFVRDCQNENVCDCGRKHSPLICNPYTY